MKLNQTKNENCNAIDISSLASKRVSGLHFIGASFNSHHFTPPFSLVSSDFCINVFLVYPQFHCCCHSLFCLFHSAVFIRRAFSLVGCIFISGFDLVEAHRPTYRQQTSPKCKESYAERMKFMQCENNRLADRLHHLTFWPHPCKTHPCKSIKSVHC